MKIQKTSLRIPEHLNNKLIKLAEYKGINKNALILGVLENYVDNENKKKRKEEQHNGN